MRGRSEPSDAQWERIEPVLRPKRRVDGRGRPLQDTRAVLSGVLWILGTGARWRELPDRYPPLQLAIAVFSSGCGRENGAHVRTLAEELQTQGKLGWRSFIDTSFTRQKKGALRWGPPSTAKDEIIALADAYSLPLAVSIESASPHESQLVEGVLGHSFLDTSPHN